MMMSYVPAGHFAITPGASALPYVAYGIRCMDAGDITYRDSLGTTWTDTVAAGDYIINTVTHVTASTCTDIRGFRHQY